MFRSLSLIVIAAVVGSRCWPKPPGPRAAWPEFPLEGSHQIATRSRWVFQLAQAVVDSDPAIPPVGQNDRLGQSRLPTAGACPMPVWNIVVWASFLVGLVAVITDSALCRRHLAAGSELPDAAGRLHLESQQRCGSA